MPNRAERRHPVPPVPAPRITVNGEWYEMGRMTARDYLFMRQLQGRNLTDEDVVGVLLLIEKRVVASSAPDPLDQPLDDVLELMRRWFTDTGDDALPPANATRSNRRSPSPRSTPKRAPQSPSATP